MLVAVPLFLFMGYLIERANILDRLFYALQLSMKNVPGALAVATLMTCTLSADHRLVDGVLGAEFLAALRRLVEAPLSLLA